MITEKDLIGQLEGFPIQVVEKMLERQVQQGNSENVRIFQNDSSAGEIQGGFTWDNTVEKHDFWYEVIHNHKFELFFEKYPKLSSEVWIKGVENRGREVIAELKRRGGRDRTGLNGNRTDIIYYIEKYTNIIRCEHINDPHISRLLEVYTEITLPEPVLEVTMEKVAKKFGVSQIKIKNK